MEKIWGFDTQRRVRSVSVLLTLQSNLPNLHCSCEQLHIYCAQSILLEGPTERDNFTMIRPMICAEMCALAIRAKVKLSQLLPGQWLPWETQEMREVRGRELRGREGGREGYDN